MFVVDASVALKWVIYEDDSEHAQRLNPQLLWAPRLLQIECANALWANVKKSNITAAEAMAGFTAIKNLPINYIADADMLDQGLKIALQLNHAIYDCLYLALALQRGAKLVTADQKFYEAAVGIYALSVMRLKDL